MKMEAINATNFKGRSFKTELKPVTILTGKNFTGKSSRIEAMTLALAGYLPGIEATPSKIMERLASGDRMAVAVQFDAGRMIGREYTRNGRSVSCNVSQTGLQRGPKADWSVEPVMVDSLVFLGLSNKERVKFLASALTARGKGKVPTAEQLFDTLAATEPKSLFQSQLRKEFTEQREQQLNSGVKAQDWLEAFLKEIDDRRKMKGLRATDLAKANKIENEQAPERQAFDRKAILQRMTETQVARQQAQTALNAAMVAARSKPADLPNDMAEQGALVRWKARVDGSAADLAKAKKELADVESMECCPKCGAAQKGWQAKIRKAAEADVVAFRSVNQTMLDGLTKADDALRAKRKEIAKLTKTESTANTEAASQAEAAKEKADEEYEAALEQYQRMNQQDADIARTDQRREETIKVNMEWETLKTLSGIIASAMEKMVNDCIQPFMNLVNELCAKILLAPIAYEDGELGMKQASGFVSWRSFSGTEKALFQCAVSLALSADAEIKCAVLDEVGRLDEDNKAKLFAGLREMIQSGTLEQAILIDAGDRAMWRRLQKGMPQSVGVIEL